VRILHELVDLQLLARSRTLSDTRPVRMPTAIAGVAQEADAQPVLDVVALELARARDVAEVDPAVGEHAVHVEPDERTGATRRERGAVIGGTAPRAPRPRARARRARSSGTMFGPSLGAGPGRVRLEEQAVGARADRGAGERRDELARAATGAALAAPGLLHGVRGVEDHGHVAGRAHAGDGAHVDHEVAIAEERAAFGDGHLIARGRRGPLAAATPEPHLVDGAAHPLGVHPLPLLDVHRAAGRAGREQQVGLAAEERRDLEHVGDLGDGRALLRGGARR
jgi:hypothetical protein